MTVLHGECISDGNKKVGRDRKEGVRKMRHERGVEGREVGKLGGEERRGERESESERERERNMGVWSQFPPNIQIWSGGLEKCSLGPWDIIKVRVRQFPSSVLPLSRRQVRVWILCLMKVTFPVHVELGMRIPLTLF